MRRVDAALEVVPTVERVHLRGALDRVLAADVTSPLDVPGFTNSAMDGYAVVGEDLPDAGKAPV